MPRIEQIYRVIFYQALFAIGVVALYGMFGGIAAAVSSFAGGCIGVVGSAILALRMVASGSEPAGLLLGFYLGEVFKLLVTLVLFYVAIVFLEVELLPLLAGFMATVVANWFSLIWVTPKNKRHKHGARTW